MCADMHYTPKIRAVVQIPHFFGSFLLLRALILA